jgi:hypothetical protein
MAAPGQKPERVFLLERRQHFRGCRQCVCILRVIAGKHACQSVGEFERFFASEMPHQKLILSTRRSRGFGLEDSDQFLRALLQVVHSYPFDPMARLNV